MCVLVALAAPLAQGATIIEQPGGTGALPGSAQLFNIATTTAIEGDLTPAAGATPANTVDMFQFTLLNPFLFSAFTVGGASREADPQLFLFNSLGIGMFWNNDISLVPSITQAGLFSIPLAAGTYYLAISLFAVDPVDAGGNYLFDTLGSNGGIVALANPVADWLDTGSISVRDDSAYRIEFSQIPEPSTVSLALLAAGAMFVWRKRSIR